MFCTHRRPDCLLQDAVKCGLLLRDHFVLFVSRTWLNTTHNTKKRKLSSHIMNLELLNPVVWAAKLHNICIYHICQMY